MNTAHVDAIAKAVLYEGYMLYPYRPSSVKNRQRFNFGVLYPREYAEAQSGADRWDMLTEVLLQGSSDTKVEIAVRFLKLIERSIARFVEPDAERDQAPGPRFVRELEVKGRIERPWQEAVELAVTRAPMSLEALCLKAVEHPFEFPANEEIEPLSNDAGETVGIIHRRQKAVNGIVEISAVAVKPELFKLRVCVKNLTLLETYRGDVTEVSRETALMMSLVSAHTLLAVTSGNFVSALEPADEYKDEIAQCRNEGVWPVLVGEQGQCDTMLASPIILYDYPQIAPESPGDLFDGTEIDEILALRILTMTDEEKHEVRESDERARKMLDRTEALPIELLQKLHGTLRDLHPVDEKAS
jgi:hypothetical protein